MKYEQQLQEQKEILENMGYEVGYICIYGSQNYGMDTPESDIDMKAVIIPSLSDLVKNSKPVSTSIQTKWGLCDIKDIRSYTECICKANPVYIETLYTDYYIMEHYGFKQLRRKRKEIINKLSNLFVRGALGQATMKREALCHPYPSIKDKIEKYGYDPKQLHHIVRLFYLVSKFVHTPPDIFTYRILSDPQFDMRGNPFYSTIVHYKKDILPVKDAVYTADKFMDEFKRIVDRHLLSVQDDYTIKDDIMKLSQTILEETITNRIIQSC